MAIEAMVGETLRTYVNYRHPNGDPILGASFRVASAIRPDGTSFADTVSFTESGDGIYQVTAPTVVTDPPGEWYLSVVGSEDDLPFQEVFDVISTRRPVVVIQNIFRSGVSRQDIRRMVAHELGDLVLVQSTERGTESSVVSATHLNLENRHYNGMSIRCTVGAVDNVGKFGTVTASLQESASINFIPPFPTVTMPGDEFELTNLRGMGWEGDKYDRAINSAIIKAGDEHFTLPFAVSAETPFSRNSPTVSIPDNMAYFCGVSYSDHRGRKQRIPPHMYRVDRYSKEVEILGPYRSRANGMIVTVEGRIHPPLLEMDDHRTPILTDWLVTEVKAILQNGVVGTSVQQGSRDRLFYMDRQGADSRRTLIIPSLPPNTIKLA